MVSYGVEAELARVLPSGRKPWVCNPIDRRRLRPRMLTAAAAGLTVVALAEPSAASFAAGLPLVLAGEGLRIWAAGHLHKTRDLATTGPYAWVRHPLYAGTLAIGCGFVAIAGWGVACVALPGLLAFFFGYYLPYKERVEDARLVRHHGARYTAYRSLVPRLAPSRPWARRTRRGLSPPVASGRCWSPECVRDNDEAGTAVLVLVILAILVGRFLLGR